MFVTGANEECKDYEAYLNSLNKGRLESSKGGVVTLDGNLLYPHTASGKLGFFSAVGVDSNGKPLSILGIPITDLPSDLQSALYHRFKTPSINHSFAASNFCYADPYTLAKDLTVTPQAVQFRGNTLDLYLEGFGHDVLIGIGKTEEGKAFTVVSLIEDLCEDVQNALRNYFAPARSLQTTKGSADAGSLAKIAEPATQVEATTTAD